MTTTLVGKVIAHGVPPLLILCGTIMVLEGELMSTLGLSSGLSDLGIVLILLGALLYLCKLLLKYDRTRYR